MYQLGDPTGVQTAATALIMVSRNIPPTYNDVIDRFFTYIDCNGPINKSQDLSAVRSLFTTLARFVSAVEYLIDLTGGDDKTVEGPRRDIKRMLKVRGTS